MRVGSETFFSIAHNLIPFGSMKKTTIEVAMSLVPTNVAVFGSWEGEKIRACTASSLIGVEIIDSTIMLAKLAEVIKSDSGNPLLYL